MVNLFGYKTNMGTKQLALDVCTTSGMERLPKSSTFIVRLHAKIIILLGFSAAPNSRENHLPFLKVSHPWFTKMNRLT